VVGRIKDRTKLKGRALLHPIRFAITCENEGPELDLVVPAIDRAVGVPGFSPVIGCRERVTQVLKIHHLI